MHQPNNADINTVVDKLIHVIRKGGCQKIRITKDRTLQTS